MNGKENNQYEADLERSRQRQRIDEGMQALFHCNDGAVIAAVIAITAQKNEILTFASTSFAS